MSKDTTEDSDDTGQSGYITSNGTGTGVIPTFTIGSSGNWSFANSPIVFTSVKPSVPDTTCGASFIRSCFPLDWDVIAVNIKYTYDEIYVDLQVRGEFDQDEMSDFWDEKMYQKESSWDPQHGETTNFKFKLGQSDGDKLKVVHQEVFDRNFIKDFENTEK
jgi:hypothetical protein